jgi:hypothetical protein
MTVMDIERAEFREREDAAVREYVRTHPRPTAVTPARPAATTSGQTGQDATAQRIRVERGHAVLIP